MLVAFEALSWTRNAPQMISVLGLTNSKAFLSVYSLKTTRVIRLAKLKCFPHFHHFKLDSLGFLLQGKAQELLEGLIQEGHDHESTLQS